MLSYDEWRELEIRISRHNNSQDLLVFANFGNQYPTLARDYERRKQEEEAQRQKIMQIKDRDARQDAIARNLSLFQ